MTGAARVIRAPRLRCGGELVHAFDEDDVTLAWDAVQEAGVRGSLHAVGIALPDWWWRGLGLTSDEDSPWTVTAAGTQVGPVVVVHASGTDAGADDAARAALDEAADLDVEAHARLGKARGTDAREGDFPLGAYVTPARHEDVLAERMRMGPGRVLTWTTVATPPTEFHRVEEAAGALHVVMVALDAGGRTVGLWTGGVPATGQAATPVLRRLFLQQGAWRHGVKFAPRGSDGAPTTL